MPEATHFDRLRAVLLLNETFARLDPGVTEGSLRSIRGEFESTSNPFDRYRSISAQIGATDKAEWRRLLMQLRAQFVTDTLAEKIGEIEQMLARSQDDGWAAWVTALAEAVSYFHHRFATGLCRHRFPFDPSREELVKELRRAVECMLQDRWEEAYEEIALLAKQEVLPAQLRARLITLKAQIELLRFENPSRARTLFEEAETIAPGDGWIIASLGDYWLDQKDIERATGYYQRARDLAPKDAGGYVGMGDRFLKDGRLDEAEAWYRRTITAAGGDTAGYAGLLSVLGRTENFSTRDGDFRALLRTRIDVDPESEYQAYINAGGTYLAADRVSEAREWFEKAVGLEKDWPRAYTELAELCRTQGNLSEAEAWCRKAIEVAPKCPSGHIVLGRLCEHQSRWADALMVYAAFPRRPLQWVSFARASVGRMHAKLWNYEEAERLLFAGLREELRSDRMHSHAQRALEDLAADHYRERSDKESARRIYDELHQLLGDKYTESYHKRLASLENAQGNRNYEHAAYGEAVEHYTKAIEHDPKEPVYHANLVGALIRVKKPGERMDYLDRAIRCYQRAQELSSKKDFKDEIDRLRRQQTVLRVYGEKALDYLHVVTPIALEVASDLIPLVVGDKPGTLSEELAASVTNMRSRVNEELGASVPGVRVRGNETDLSNGTYIVMINEIPLVSGSLSLDRRFCIGSGAVPAAPDVRREPASDPVSGQEGFWIDRKDWERIEPKELWGTVKYLTRHLEAVVRRNITDFVGHQEIMNLLVGESAAALAEIRQSSRMVSALTTVCKALVAEEVPIRPFPVLCAIFKDRYADGVGLRGIVEHIRGHSAFRKNLPGNDLQHAYLRLGTRFETEIRHALYERDGRLILAMEPKRCQDALATVRNHVKGRSLGLVVDDATLRPFVRKLVELEFPDLHVLSRAELRDDIEIGPEAVIELDGEPAARPAEFRRPRTDGGIAADTGERSASAVSASSDIRVEVFVSTDFAAKESAGDDMPADEMLAMMQDGLFYELGIIVPEVQLRTDHNLKDAEFRIRLNGVEHPPTTGFRHDEFLVNDTVDRLTLIGIKEARKHFNPANGNECAVVQGGHDQAMFCKQAGLSTWGRKGYLVLKLSAEIRQAAPQFQTDEVTRFILDSLAAAFPDLVRAALDRYGLSQIAQVLREMLDEEISIRDMRSILESLLSIDGTTDVDQNRFIVFLANADCLCPASPPRSAGDLTAAQLADFVRMNLKRYISHKYIRGGSTLVVYLLDPAIERRLANIGARALTEPENEKLRAAIDEEVRTLPPTTAPVLLTTFDIRRSLRKLIEREFPQLAVVSYQELSPDMNIQPIARISWT